MSAADRPRLLGDKITLPTGPKTIRIGGKSFRVPNDAVLVAGPEGLTYVRAAGRVHCFTPRAEEITIPGSLQAPLRAAYFATAQ